MKTEYRLELYEKSMPTDVDWSEKLDAAAAAGFDYVEISIDESDGRQARLLWTPEQRRRLLRTAENSGIPFSTMCLSAHRKYPLGSHNTFIRQKSLQIMRQSVTLAADLGIRIIQLAGYDVYYEESDESTRKYFLDNLRICTELASSAGVLLGFETMETPFMDTVSKAMEYVTTVHSPYLGIYPDLGNLNNAMLLYGGNPLRDLETGSGHLLAIHLKETKPGIYRDMRFGTGQVDFSGGIARALALGIRMFTAECWYDGNPEWRNSLAMINRFFRRIFLKV